MDGRYYSTKDPRYYLQHDMSETKLRLAGAREVFELTGNSHYQQQILALEKDVKWYEQEIAKLSPQEEVKA